MPMILVDPTIAANSTNTNLVAGSAFEIARQRALLSVGLVAAAAGVIGSLNAGADIIAEPFTLPILTTYPKLQDDFYFQDVVEPLDRIVARAQNTTGAAIQVRGVFQLSGGG